MAEPVGRTRPCKWIAMPPRRWWVRLWRRLFPLRPVNARLEQRPPPGAMRGAVMMAGRGLPRWQVCGSFPRGGTPRGSTQLDKKANVQVRNRGFAAAPASCGGRSIVGLR